jgi:hypothetical protein
MHVAAIIAAGGRGERLGADRPKQFLEIGGRSILELSIAALAASDRIGKSSSRCLRTPGRDREGAKGSVATPLQFRERRRAPAGFGGERVCEDLETSGRRS